MTVHGENMAGWDVPSPQEQLFEAGTTQFSYYWNGEKHSSAENHITSGISVDELTISLDGISAVINEASASKHAEASSD